MTRLSLCLLVLALAACQSDPATDASAGETGVGFSDTEQTPPSEEAAAPDADAVATTTSTVLVDYEGRLLDGTVFDSGERVEFRLPELIDGVKNGIAGMRAGESKTITVPPEEGYGPDGIPGLIPPGEDIVFDVTVHEVLR